MRVGSNGPKAELIRLATHGRYRLPPSDTVLRIAIGQEHQVRG